MDRYYWWNEDDLRKAGFHDVVTCHGSENLRREFHPNGRQDCRDEKLNGVPLIRLVRKDTGETVGEYNIVFQCPPNCT